MKYSIVIPTYNHCNDLLKPCIESIIKYTNLNDIQLVVAANGCSDETEEYLKYIKHFFKNKNLANNFTGIVCDQPLGYAKATNEGIRHAVGDKIVLLNNDTLLLEQPLNRWLDVLNLPFKKFDKCGISCIHKMWSGIVDKHFASFFCVMIDKKVFNKIGLLDERYDIGTCEDVDFCLTAENAGFELHACIETWAAENTNSGNFPIYHHGSGTLNDKKLLPIDITGIWFENCLRLGKKFNSPWYNWYISTDEYNDYARKTA